MPLQLFPAINISRNHSFQNNFHLFKATRAARALFRSHASEILRHYTAHLIGCLTEHLMYIPPSGNSVEVKIIMFSFSQKEMWLTWDEVKLPWEYVVKSQQKMHGIIKMFELIGFNNESTITKVWEGLRESTKGQWFRDRQCEKLPLNLKGHVM